jgi:hypothetical protein
MARPTNQSTAGETTVTTIITKPADLEGMTPAQLDALTIPIFECLGHLPHYEDATDAEVLASGLTLLRSGAVEIHFDPATADFEMVAAPGLEIVELH